MNKRLEPLRQQKSSALVSMLLLKLIMDAVIPAHPGKRARACVCVCVCGGGGGGGGGEDKPWAWGRRKRDDCWDCSTSSLPKNEQNLKLIKIQIKLKSNKSLHHYYGLTFALRVND